MFKVYTEKVFLNKKKNDLYLIKKNTFLKLKKNNKKLIYIRGFQLMEVCHSHLKNQLISPFFINKNFEISIIFYIFAI